MFDTLLSGAADLAELGGTDDAAVAAAITAWTRIEAAAAARRLAAVAELVRRRTDVSIGHSRWACDDWDAAAAEVAAALGASHGKASSQMYLALALRERLPKVAALFAEGKLGAHLVAVISWHTTLIQDRDALAAVDEVLADDARRYGALSAAKTAQAIDAIVDRHDPAALRHTRAYARGRDLVIGTHDDPAANTGTTALWGRLYAHDAALLDRRLMAMAHGVCDDDPRTIAQRRADALGALAAGAEQLMCGCDNADCPVKTEQQRPPGSAVIHVMADAATVDTPVDARTNGDDNYPPRQIITADTPLDEVLGPAPEPEPPAVQARPALLVGGPLIPAPLLAELIRTGATIRPVRHPGATSSPEPGYRPSTALDEYIRCRDLTCRFPNCDRPAEFCDIDHAIAYAVGGLTHPSNLRCLCRKHHLLKTFWGWRDIQHPDGSIVWTSPTGQSYTTHPGARLLFPALCRPTGELPVQIALQPDSPGRTLTMPTRRRTRAQHRAQRINAERALNADYAAQVIAERNKPPPF